MAAALRTPRVGQGRLDWGRKARATRKRGKDSGMLWKTLREVRMPYIYLIIAVLVIAAVISLVFSFLGILLVGALRLLPIVFIALLIAVLIGKVRITVVHGKKRDDD